MEISTVIAVFGATGDLTRKKILGAFFKLFMRGIVSEKTPLLMISRRDWSVEQYLDYVNFGETIEDKDALSKFLSLIHYKMIDLENSDIQGFNTAVDGLHKQFDTGGNLLTYLAVSPHLFEKVLPVVKSHKGKGYSHIVFEKPFGHDLESAEKLNKTVQNHFNEDQVYRIDHYLGKALVQTILGLRFANPLFEALWNKEHVDHVQLTVAEEVGVATRAGYYDHSGAILDMMQNHLLQVLSLVGMEPPEDMSAESIRGEKVRFLKSIESIKSEDLVIGQYDSGELEIKDSSNKVPAYREEAGIGSDSKTETYAALRLFVNNERWSGVPIYLRTGKRMSKRSAHINIVLKPPKTGIMKKWVDMYGTNVITLRLQPHEGIGINFLVKVPGVKMDLIPAELDFCYPCRFSYNTPEAYEVLLEEALMGDQTLFTRWDFVKESWIIIDKIKEYLSAESRIPELYAAGTQGPKGADILLNNNKHSWIPL
jgi:glucose-6-phosphate 1-dehydrogenase